MKPLLSLLLLAGPAAGQLQLFVVEGTRETPATGIVEMGAAAAGASVDVRLRLRNQSAAAIDLQWLSAEGEGFRLAYEPILPRTIGPGGFADQIVRFTPPAIASYTGRLRVNGSFYELRGRGAAWPVLQRQAGTGWQDCDPAVAVDLGALPALIVHSFRFRLFNRTTATLLIEPLRVSGAGFGIVGGPPASTPVGAGGELVFSVTVMADAPGAREAALDAAGQRFVLRATANALAVGSPRLNLASSTLESGKEGRLNIRWDTPALADLDGLLTLEFRPETGLGDDPAILFVPAAERSLAFRWRAGTTVAEFGGRDYAAFQTGTTAGTLTFRTTIAGRLDSETFAIPRAAATIDSVRAVVAGATVEVSIRAFDNTRTAGRLGFLFRRRDGTTIPAQGRLEADATALFRDYFGKNPRAAGAFLLRAVFPVSGTASELESVELELANEKGTTNPARATVQ